MLISKLKWPFLFRNQFELTLTYFLIRFSCSLKGTDDYFYLDLSSQNLKIKKKIDREKLSHDVIRLVAQNSQSILDIFVQVLDENDNTPYFVPSSVNLTIFENAETSSKVRIRLCFIPVGNVE